MNCLYYYPLAKEVEIGKETPLHTILIFEKIESGLFPLAIQEHNQIRESFLR